MFNINEIWASDEKLNTLTGLNINEANLVFYDFEIELEKIRNPKKSKAGRPPKLNSKQIFLMLMIFIRNYQTYKFIALMFGIDASNVKRWIDDSIMALGQVLVKKNFHHLLLTDRKRLLESPLEDWEKFILMDLNNLSGGQKII